MGVHHSPGSYLRGIIYGIIDIIVVLEVTRPTWQHMDVHMWHGLPRINAVLHTFIVGCEVYAHQMHGVASSLQTSC